MVYNNLKYYLTSINLDGEELKNKCTVKNFEKQIYSQNNLKEILILAS